ncbi:4Fe-4S binding protein [candidate division KSB1 bacterium]
MGKRIKPTDIIIDQRKCDLCGTCIGVCPPNCISITNNTLSVGLNDCIFCSFCIDICPLKALDGVNN